MNSIFEVNPMHSGINLERTDLIAARLFSRASAIASLVLLLLFALGVAQGQVVTDLFTFNGVGSLASPQSVIPAQGRDGKLYGTASGYPDSNGSIFRLDISGRASILHTFAGTDGATPAAGLLLATDGNYYGTAALGGSTGNGVLFKVAANGSYTVLHDFQGSDGSLPIAPPMEAVDGNLYGTAYQGGLGYGAIYKYTRSGSFSTIYQFDLTHGELPDGALIQATDGFLYGTAESGGAKGCGAVIKLTTFGTLLHSFGFPCNGGLAGPVVQASDGNFYGTTIAGGQFRDGTIYKMTPTGVISTLHAFSAGDGRGPFSGLTQGTDGGLYGTTLNGGTSDDGVLFRIATDGTFSLLYSFSSSAGGNPVAPPLQDTSGLFYGTATTGGPSNLGVVYSLDMGLGPFVTFVRPTGNVGGPAQILGQGLTGTTTITFNGVAATSFKVVSDTYMTATVPSGATTGPVLVTTPNGTLASNVSFRILR